MDIFERLTEFHLLRFAAIFALGLAAQWVAWRFRIPALLNLLVAGFLAGPVTGLLDPDILFNDLLSPVIALSVGCILFTAAAELQLSELRRGPKVLFRLVFVGALVTFVGAAIAAKFITDVNASVAALLGAIAILSGPTVIIPLLRETPLKGNLGALVRWEGSCLEGVGTVIALITFQIAYGLAKTDSRFDAIWNVAKTLLVGGGFGAFSALLVVGTVRALQIPDMLKGGVCLAILLAGFALSYLFVPESGLLTAVVAGLILGNQRLVSVQRYLEFGDLLRIPLFSALFVILAARVSVSALGEFSREGLLFILVLVFIVRPLSVFAGTIGSDVTARERLFLSFFAPRGAAAAALASLFALDLLDLGYPGAERIVPLTFLIIIVTVGVYGLSAPIVARLLDLAELTPRGVLILGAHDWAREVAKALMQAGLRVLIVDSNQYNILAARRDGIPARCENIFLDHSLDEVVLDGIKHFLALTSNTEVNTLASLHFAELFGAGEVYQLAGQERAPTQLPTRSRRYQNQVLFGNETTFESLESRFNSGWKIRSLAPDELEKIQSEERQAGELSIVLFVILRNGQFLPSTADAKLFAPAGAHVVALVSPAANAPDIDRNASSRVVQFPRR